MRRIRVVQFRGEGERGFTLVEMLIAIVLIAVIAAFALPRLDFVDMRLDANMRIVRSVLQQSWRASIQKQHDLVVSFDVATHRVRIVEDMDNDGAIDSGERVSWRPLEEGVLFDVPPAGVNGSVGAAVAGPGVRTLTAFPSVIFHRNGSTSGDIEIYLSAQKRGGKGWRALTVAQTTGRSDWFRAVNGTWQSGGI